MKYWFYLFILITSPILANESVYSVYTEEFQPFSYLSDEQQVIGVATEKVARLFQLADLKYNIQINPWFRAEKTVLETPNTFIYSLVRTEKRENDYLWIMPLCPLNIALFKLAERTDIQASNLEQAKAYVIGVERNQLTANFLLSKGFVKSNNLVIVKDHTQTQGMLNKGRVDLIFSSDNTLAPPEKNSAQQKPWQRLFRVKELSQPMYLAANSQSSPEVVEKLKRTYQQHKSMIFDRMNCQ
ncbi:substrate-binding periplasmic protein [Colwelliaceae bacterium 6441]